MQDWMTAYQALSERAKSRHDMIIRDWNSTCVIVWDDLVNNGYDETQLVSRGWHYEMSQTDFHIIKKLIDDYFGPERPDNHTIPDCIGGIFDICNVMWECKFNKKHIQNGWCHSNPMLEVYYDLTWIAVDWRTDINALCQAVYVYRNFVRDKLDRFPVYGLYYA